MAAQSFEELVTARTTELNAALRRPRWRFRRRPWDAELRKVMCGLVGAIADARRLHDLDRLTDAGRHRLADILGSVGPSMSLDDALETIDALEGALIDHGDETYLYSRIRGELHRAPSPQKGVRPTTALTMSDVFGEEEFLPLLLNPTWSAEDLAEVRKKLAGLARAQTMDYRLQRARARLRSVYLLWLGLVLAVLVAALAFAIDRAGAEREVILVVALSGAVGGTISGIYKLRDGIRRISQLRAFMPAMVVQPLVGAAAGLVLFLLLEAGFRGASTGAQWAASALFAFAAGFSEPFFLGVVRSVADLGDSGRPPAKGKPVDETPAEPAVPTPG